MTTISAPGKVLLAGGYLVLDPKYSGLVIGASSRFYSALEPGRSGEEYLIRVMSPQFVDARWKYKFQIDNDGKLGISQIYDQDGPTSKNKFVQLALEKTLQLVKEIKGVEHLRTSLQPGLDVAILGGNDFYSQRAQLEARGLPRTIKSLEEIPPFVHLGVTLDNAHKTGMGSSAALITSLVAALLVHLKGVDSSAIMEPLGEGRRLIHNLAQYVHCLAQGKVGSGFDVSAAIFGSHIYTRFDPSVISPLMDATATDTPLLPVLRADNTQWSYKTEPFQLPPLCRLLLADVDAGSDTPSMASKVLKWRKENESEALELWTRLDKNNMEFVKVLSRLVDDYNQDRDSYTKAAELATQAPPSKWDPSAVEDAKVQIVLKDFKDAYSVSQRVRQEMKRMGELADVPIEPDKQTRLLDACLDQPGVIGGGVPGAGGYDAIWVLVLDLNRSQPQDPANAVESVWQEWKEMNVSPLMASESAARGLRVEEFPKVPGLLKAVRGQ